MERQAKGGALSFRHWVLILLLIAVMTYVGGRFLYGHWGGHTHPCPVGKICVTELT